MSARPRKRTRLSGTGFVRLAQYLWRFKTTPAGKAVFGGLLVGASLGSLGLFIPIYRLFCVVGALWGLAFVAAHLRPRRVEVAGTFPAKAIAGQTVGASYRVTNLSRGTAYDVALGLFGLPPSLQKPPAAVVVSCLRSGESASVPVAVHPLKRGIYSLPPLKAYTTFPFGLFRVDVTTKRRDFRHPSAGSLLVLPSFHPVTAIEVPVGRRYQPGGIALTSKIGESPEYIGNREYRPGDPPHRIDFRSWARLAKPVTREYQEEYYCRIALVLDTHVPPGAKARPEGFPALEAAVSLSAAVADVLARGEYIIDIFAAGPELYVFRAGRHTAHFENVLEILACVGACRTNPFETITPALAEEMGTISTVLCVFLDWDASREGLVRMAREMGCSVKVLIVCDGETTQPVASPEDVGGEVSIYSTEAVRSGGLDVL